MWGHFEVSVSNVTKILILEKIDLLIVICGHVWIFELVQWFWLAWGYNAQGVTTKDTRHTPLACLWCMSQTCPILTLGKIATQKSHLQFWELRRFGVLHHKKIGDDIFDYIRVLHHSGWKSTKVSHLALFINFCPIKIERSGNTVAQVGLLLIL